MVQPYNGIIMQLSNRMKQLSIDLERSRTAEKSATNCVT